MSEFDELNEMTEMPSGPLTGGINTYVRADRISAGEVLKATNLRMEKDQVVIDTGYAAFGGATRGKPRLLHQIHSRTGARTLVLVTNDTFYKYVLSEWQYVSDGTESTAAIAVVAAAVTITVLSMTGFSNNDYIGIELDNGTQHQTTVNGVPIGDVITFTDAIPAGRSVPIGAKIVKAVDLNGVDERAVRFDVYSAYDWFVFTNQIDPPRRYDISDCIVIPGLPSAGVIVCQDIKVQTNHLLLLGVDEAGVARPQRVRWSDTGDPTNWTSGNAGYEDLLNDPYAIIGAENLGPYLIIYKTNSIIRCSYAGSAFRIFYFETAISNEGAVSANAIVQVDDKHVFMGHENVYVYAAGMEIQPIGNGIYYDVMGSGGDLNTEYRHTTLGLYVKNTKEIWFAYPSGTSLDPDKLVKIRIDTNAWVTREFAHTILGWGLYTTSNDKAWGELTGTWGSQTWLWGDQRITSGASHVMLCGDGGQVYEYDYADTDDAGTGIAYVLETQELYHEKMLTRIDSISFRLRSSTLVTIEYSVDRGATWVTYGTSTPGTIFADVDIHKQLVAKRIRFRFTGTGGNFGLEWYYIKSSTESEW